MKTWPRGKLLTSKFMPIINVLFAVSTKLNLIHLILSLTVFARIVLEQAIWI